jgi:hypothetical protein
MDNHAPTNDARTAQTTASLIGLSLAMGVTLFVGMAYWINGTRGPAPMDAESGTTLIYVWIALGAGSAIAALSLWRSRVDPVINGPESHPRDAMSSLTSNLVVCWALIEGPAIFGAYIYFVYGVLWIGLVSVAAMWLTILMTRPQLEWFERFRL